MKNEDSYQVYRQLLLKKITKKKKPMAKTINKKKKL